MLKFKMLKMHVLMSNVIKLHEKSKHIKFFATTIISKQHRIIHRDANKCILYSLENISFMKTIN